MLVIGLIGGTSWEATAVYYRLINEDVKERLGGYHSARILLAMEGQDMSIYRLSDTERAEIRAALAEVERGEVATDEQVSAVFNRFRNG